MCALRGRAGARGVTMIVAMFFMLVVALVSVAIIRYAGQDRIAAARMGVQERGVACAEAGIQYGRRFFGCSYKSSGLWNDYLTKTKKGRYDPSLGDTYPTSSSDTDIPAELKGDIDGDGKPDYWVSIRDDDDERPEGATDDRTRDNNLAVYLRSECINPAWAVDSGGQKRTAVVEVLLVYVPGTSSPYGKATSASDFPEASGSGPAVLTTLGPCDN